MLLKRETKSSRVKGISFHPKLPWILTSLFDGIIQLWDYRVGSLIEKFEDHKGPVRSVDFHSTQPLFVSGGDDSTIKIWNYRLRRCIFTLIGHLDYVRTVRFHPSHPWVVSASDDQTVRIWNWQSRTCVAVLTGHNHYVMCAQFHPKDDLIVSASLDQTIRIWNIAGLREKSVSIGSILPPSQLQQQIDMFSPSDAVCKFVLEGHDRGVNWATFHHTLQLVASGADDRVIRLWRYNDNMAWGLDTLTGHIHNVCCVVFHPYLKLLISNSEDRSIRVWDTDQRIPVHSYRRENDKFWITSVHPYSNLLAVGHDSGIIVFKLKRERPASAWSETTLYYAKDQVIQSYDPQRDITSFFVSCRTPANAMSAGPRYMLYNSYNQSAINLIVFYDQDNGSFDLLKCEKNFKDRQSQSNVQTSTNVGLSVAFLARNRLAVLEKPSTLGIYNLSNELMRRLDISPATERVFAAGPHRLFLKHEDKISLYDATSRSILAHLSISGSLKDLIWSPDEQLIALLFKESIALTNPKFEWCKKFHENIRIKGGIFDERGVFLYTTASHLKYCMINGDRGILMCLDEPIYIQRIRKDLLFYLDREGKVKRMPLPYEEYFFKLTLHKNHFDQVASLIRSGRLCGNTILGYLKRSGFPEVAMQFVADPTTRFNLSLDYGNVEEALRAAKQLNEPAIWCRLGKEALRYGKSKIVAMAYQKLKSLDKLSFLYFITGSLKKLQNLQMVSRARNNYMSRYYNACILGDLEERINVLAEIGQLPLAALTARVHGLTDVSAELETHVTLPDIQGILPKNPTFLAPPIRILGVSMYESFTAKRAENDTFAEEMSKAEPSKFQAAFLAQPSIRTPSFADTAALQSNTADIKLSDSAEDASFLQQPDDWSALDQILSETIALKNIREEEKKPGEAVIPSLLSRGKTLKMRLVRDHPTAADCIAAGNFSMALDLLKRRIGLINPMPLKPMFTEIYQAAWAMLPGPPMAPPLRVPVLSSGCLRDEKLEPERLYTCEFIEHIISKSHQLFNANHLKEALISYRKVLQILPFCVAHNAKDEQFLFDAIRSCKNYVSAVKLQIERPTLEQDPARSLEMLSLSTCCDLQKAHLLMLLRKATIEAFSAKNYITAASFARRLLELNKSGVKLEPRYVVKVESVLLTCESIATDQYKLDFIMDDSANTMWCSKSMTRINPGEPIVKCPYTQSIYREKFRGIVCEICEICEVGATVLGAQFRPTIV